MRVSSFVIKEEVEKILAEIPWGKRSDFINECILKVCKEKTENEIKELPLKLSSGGESSELQKRSNDRELGHQEKERRSALELLMELLAKGERT